MSLNISKKNGAYISAGVIGLLTIMGATTEILPGTSDVSDNLGVLIHEANADSHPILINSIKYLDDQISFHAQDDKDFQEEIKSEIKKVNDNSKDMYELLIDLKIIICSNPNHQC